METLVYFLTVNLDQITTAAEGHSVYVLAVAKESESAIYSYEDGMAIATVVDGSISVVIMSKELMDETPSDNVRYYQDGNVVELEFYIDIDGDGDVYGEDDEADAVTYFVTIDGDTVVDADYTAFAFH